MQMEAKIALDFLLSYLYDKLPRRRVNLFGDELQKYLLIKLSNTDEFSNCLNINNKTFTMPDIVDPCLIAAAKDAAIDINEILVNLPQRLKLFIEPGIVFYAILNNLDEVIEMKILYQSNEITKIVIPPKPKVKEEDLLVNKVGNLSLKEERAQFTAATFAQTKFGTTKKKSPKYNFNPTPRVAKQQNQKMLSNEFSEYIKSKSELKNQKLQANTNDLFGDNLISNKLDLLLQQQLCASPVISPASSSSSVSSYDLFASSTFDDMEENFINNYFSPQFLTPNSLQSSSLLTNFPKESLGFNELQHGLNNEKPRQA